MTKQQQTTAPAPAPAPTVFAVTTEAGHVLVRRVAPGSKQQLTHAVLVTVNDAYRASILASSSPDKAMRYLDERVERWSASQAAAETRARSLVAKGESARVVPVEALSGTEATDIAEMAATQFDSLESDRLAQVEAATARKATGAPRPAIDPAAEAVEIARVVEAHAKVAELRTQLAQATADRNALVAAILAMKGASGVKISKAIGVDYASVYAWKDSALRAAAKTEAAQAATEMAAPAPAPAA